MELVMQKATSVAKKLIDSPLHSPLSQPPRTPSPLLNKKSSETIDDRGGLCHKCGKALNGKQKRWCSKGCSKLGLKSEYRKRNHEKIYKYKNEYRRAKNGGNRPPKIPSKLREDKCLKCGATEDLQLAHIKPLWAGGVHKNVITLCRKHHYQFDNLLRDWWKSC